MSHGKKSDDPINNPFIIGLFSFIVILVFLFGAVFYILTSIGNLTK